MSHNSREIVHIEREVCMMASRTPGQIEAQKKYESKVKEIKIRVPNAYYEKIEQSRIEYNKSNKGKEIDSTNKYVLMLLEKAIDEPMITIREQNKLDKKEVN